MSASTVKWAPFDPCILGLSVSDSKQYFNFEFCEKQHHKHFKNILAHITMFALLCNVYMGCVGGCGKGGLVICKLLFYFIACNASKCSYYFDII